MDSLKTRIWLWAAVAVLAMALAACGSGSEPQELTFDINVAEGKVVGETTTYVATQDDTVTFNINADKPGTVHVHGYDIEKDTAEDGTLTMTFVANATGQFGIEMHPAGAHSHEMSNDCNVDATGVSVEVTAEPGAQLGEYTVSVDTQNFDINQASGNHWHLMSDGELVGMYYEPSVDVMLGEGTHELTATLSDASHCELPVSDTVMVGEGDAHDNETDDHSHEDEEDAISLGALQVQPR